jgi:hypothetical protein
VIEPIPIDSVQLSSRGVIYSGPNPARFSRLVCRSFGVPYTVAFGRLSVKPTRRRRSKALAR